MVNIPKKCSVSPLSDFYMALGLNDFDGEKSITRAIGAGGH
jgi:hypothetical protein